MSVPNCLSVGSHDLFSAHEHTPLREPSGPRPLRLSWCVYFLRMNSVIKFGGIKLIFLQCLGPGSVRQAHLNVGEVPPVGTRQNGNVPHSGGNQWVHFFTDVISQNGLQLLPTYLHTHTCTHKHTHAHTHTPRSGMRR